jgi:hypothetical protein
LKKKCLLTILSFCFIWSGSIWAQQGDIDIINPSFEGKPKKGVFILNLRGWKDCGMIHFRDETPPDILPVDDGWKNETKPAHGNTFLGLVVRDNDSWEAISQFLENPLKAESTYEFSIAMMQSDTYISGTRSNPRKKINFQKPAKLRIWGGSSHCNSIELLGVSPLVKNRDWQKYTFEFNPTQDHRFIILEAMYDSPESDPYNGHILLDNASTIRKLSK